MDLFLHSGSVLSTDVTVAHENTSTSSSIAGSSITKDWSHWKEKLGAPYILQNQTKTVFATLGHTTYLHCFVGNIGDRQVRRSCEFFKRKNGNKTWRKMTIQILFLHPAKKFILAILDVIHGRVVGMGGNPTSKKKKTYTKLFKNSPKNIPLLKNFNQLYFFNLYTAEYFLPSISL